MKPLNIDEIQHHLATLNSAWNHTSEKDIDRIERTFTCNDFPAAINFVQAVAAVAENENHHPDIHIHYNKVRIVVWTHSIRGLSNNDFILAAKIDALPIIKVDE